MNQIQSAKHTMKLSPGSARLKYGAGIRWFLLFLFVLLFYMSMAPQLIPTTYDITKGGTADRDIIARKQWDDERATTIAREQAAEAVEPKYSIVSLQNHNLVEVILLRMEQLNAEDQVSFQNKVDIYRREIPDRYDEFVNNFVRNQLNSDRYNATLLEEMEKNVKEQRYQLTEETYYKLPLIKPEQIAEMRPVAVDVVRRLMNEQLRDAETARAKVAELVNTSSLTQKTAREIVAELARYAIMPNRFFDKEATDKARLQAKENTPTVVIREGDVVVKQGAVITDDIYAQLEGMGLLKDRTNYWPNLALLIISLLITLGIYCYLEQTGIPGAGQNRKYNNAQLFMLLLIYMLNVLIMAIISLIQANGMPQFGYLAPVAMGPILIVLLLDMRLAVISSFLFATIGSVIYNRDTSMVFDFNYGFTFTVVSFAAIYAVHRISQRATILKAGIMVSLFGTIASTALALFQDSAFKTDMMMTAVFAFGSGLLTAVLVIGLMPFFEVSFGILSALKLLELSNPNHPLLRKLLTETPGTYHHSVMVGNLSEAAAEAIGANGLLCRVGSFYHDIGKTKRPSYFIENQSNIENPHDSIDPKLSKSIIIAHARDGVEMLKAHNIPKPLRDIAEQHHGTTFLKYFYHKALKQAEAEGREPDFTEDDFRYPGPRAQSKEAAIVGIADCIEAAVRSLRNPTTEQIDSMIHKIIKGRLEDDQFNECDLTLKELEAIAQTMKETVIGIFHSRIEYPEDVKPKERA